MLPNKSQSHNILYIKLTLISSLYPITCRSERSSRHIIRVDFRKATYAHNQSQEKNAEKVVALNK
jgi:hypothetical protein